MTSPIPPRIEEARGLSISSAGFFNPREVEQEKKFKPVGRFLSVGKSWRLLNISSNLYEH